MILGIGKKGKVFRKEEPLDMLGDRKLRGFKLDTPKSKVEWTLGQKMTIGMKLGIVN